MKLLNKDALIAREIKYYIMKEKLTEYMIEYNFGVTEKKTFAIKVIDTDTFNDYEDE